MSSKFCCSLTAFSLTFQSFLCADTSAVQEESFEEVIIDNNLLSSNDKKTQEFENGSSSMSPERDRSSHAKNISSSSEQKPTVSENTEKTSSPKKLKPHYAGARRAPEKNKSDTPQKKPSHVKNQWFSSKTHPKVGKKETPKEEKTSTELPADSPRYIKTSSQQTSSDYFQVDSTKAIAWRSSTPHSAEEKQEIESDYYPKSGFQAPNGHFYVTGEWLFWGTRQEGMEFVTAKKVDFDFQSGFRVGLGVHLPNDRWDIYINYTRFNPEDEDSAHGSFYPLFLFQGTGGPRGSFVSEAHAHWEIEFQNLDVEIGRAFYIAKTLNLRPFFGLKGAWIDQDAHIRYEGGFIAAEQIFRTYFKNDFKGAGPLLGIESNWILGAGFSFFADLTTALIVGHFDDHQKQYQLNGVEVVNLDSDFNLVSPTVQMIAGLAWDRNFNQERCHVGLSAGFESQYWWCQNQTEQFTDDQFPIYVREQGDLAFYGLTLRGRFDF